MMPVKFVMSQLPRPTRRSASGTGDIFYANEARYGGIHNPDQMAFMPVFHDGELIAWTAALSHQPETGGDASQAAMPLLALGAATTRA